MITEIIAIKASFLTLEALNKDGIITDIYFRDKLREINNKLKDLYKSTEIDLNKIERFEKLIEEKIDTIDVKTFVI